MTAVPDPVAAFVSFLKDDPDTVALVGTRVYGGELPTPVQKQMPLRCVVLQPSGGGASGRGWLTVLGLRLDVRCYATRPDEAMAVYLAVHGALKQMRRNVQDGTVLHWAAPVSSAMSLRDPDAEWPFVLSVWETLSGEEEAA